MLSTTTLFATLIVILISIFFLSTLLRGCRSLKASGSPNIDKLGKGFFYQHLQKGPKNQQFEHLLFDIATAQACLRFFFGVVSAAILFLYSLTPITFFIGVLFFLTTLLLFGDFLPRIWNTSYGETATAITTPFASLILTIFLPITTIAYKANNLFSENTLHSSEEKDLVRMQLLEMLHNTNTANLAPEEKKMLESVVSFRDRIAREVMVPRVKLFCLPANTTIEKAASKLEQEGYSRIPVYHNTVDEIAGVLMYKDLLTTYMQFQTTKNPSCIQAPISTLLKPVIYTPETKKISHLLQEFRAKASHLAIVVDEYGGTEGLVTIEDILEEIVGEIADEYDEEDVLFRPLPSGGWIVDAKMSINDVEEELGIKIPQQPDYDTLGGYIYQRAGNIPQQGFTIEHDDFLVEIVNSSERSVEQVKLIPANPQKEQ